MFKRTRILAAIVAASSFASVAAFAADVPFPVKAPVLAPLPAVCAPGACSGWYAGFSLMGNGTNVDVLGSGLNNSVFAAGGALKVQGGYQFWAGSLFAAIEGGIGYEFTTPASAAVIQSQGSRFVGAELVKLGYNFFPNAAPAVTVPGQSPVALPTAANLLASTTPYLIFGGQQRYGVNAWVNGAGVETVVAKGWTTSADYTYAPPQSGHAAVNTVTLSINRHF